MHPRIRELLDHLDSQRVILRAAFNAVPPAARNRPPAPGRWSPAGIVEHLAIIEQRVGPALAARITTARAEGVGVDTSSEPVLPTIDLKRVVSRTTRVNAPEVSHPSGLDAETAWAALERAGATVRETLGSADGLALGAITHPHPVLGELSLYEWFAIIGSHEARHAAQIREIAELSRPQESRGSSAAVRTYAEIGVLEFLGARLALVCTAAETGGLYSLFDYTAPARYSGPPPHWHERSVELFYILSGRLQVSVASHTVVVGPGEAVHVPPGVVHAFANPHEEPVRFLVHMMPGGFEEYFRALVRLAAESADWPPSDPAVLQSLARQHDTFPPPGPDAPTQSS